MPTFQIITWPGAWVRYCPIQIGGDFESFDFCDTLTQNDWLNQAWEFEANTDTYSASLLNCVRVSVNPSGLLASIDTFPDGGLYDATGTLVDVMEYNAVTGCYEPQNGPIEVDQFYYVWIDGISVTLGDFLGTSCTHVFYQTGGAAGAPVRPVGISMFTTKQTSFNFTITGSLGDVDWGDGSAFEAYDATIGSDNPTYTYASPGTYNVIVYPTNAPDVEDFVASNQQLTGAFVLASCLGIDNLQVNTNSALTSISNPPTSATITVYYAYDCDITGTLDFNNMSLAGDVQIYSNANMTGFTFGPCTGAFTNFWFHSCDITGTVSFASCTALAGYLAGHTNPNLTGLTLPTSGASGVNRLDFKDCDLTGTVDFSGMTGCTDWDFSGNGNMTGLTAPTSSASIINWNFTNCDLTGAVSLSGMTGFTSGSFLMQNNANMTGLTFNASPGAGSFTNFWVSGATSLTSLDISGFTALSGYLFFNNNSAMTSITLPSSGAGGVTRFQAQSSGLSGTLDLSSLTGCTLFFFDSSSSITGVTNPTSSATIATYYASSCGLTTVDMSSFSALGGDVRFNSNSGLTTITWPTVSTGSFSVIWISSCALTSCDFSPMTNLSGQVLFSSNSSLTSVTMPASTGTLTKFDGASCDLTYFDTTNMTVSAACDVTMQSNSMTDAEVDHFLVDWDANFPTTSVTGSINIAGTNAAPTDGSVTGFDGITAASNLTTNGWTVTTS